ncbi:hypothetical protein PR048_013904 [Dryococelus australis]|uniref:Uncharacterized protein n=1 Tax=Dryococelus australis TaxID=614101 RepID=A0ABQ9HTH6_9NEOP|nr:hypothetical protein PR048_013904 [Dryococelus australis]
MFQKLCSRVILQKGKKYGRMTDVMKKICLSSHETGPDCKCKWLKCFDNVSPEQSLLKIKEWFVSIHGITTRRVRTLPNLGKSLVKNLPRIEKAVKEHIASFKDNPSHYSRGASKKLYLPSELNVNKMHQMYKYKGLPIVSYEYYRMIFNLHFNIKFGYPRSDTCSTCDKFQAEIHVLEERIKNASNEEEKNIILKEERKLE